MTNDESQADAILAVLRAGRSLTPLEALREFGCLRLGARIYDLKKRGFNIVNEWESEGGKRWAKYRLTIPIGTQYTLIA